MRRLLLALILIFFVNASLPANAGYFADKKAAVQLNHQKRIDKKIIKKLLKTQNEYADSFDGVSLAKLYSDDFKSSDGFGKDVYFKLIDETWKSYPDITYTTEIKNINIDGDEASVDVYETSLATTSQIEDNATIFGELHSYSNGTYHFKKINGQWLIYAESIKNEKSILKYGDLRFVDLDLVSPEAVKAGEYYTASLTVDVPEDALIVASIGRDNISYPQEKTEDIFRRLPEDHLLERMFLANKDGKNEYNVASVAMTKSQIQNGKIGLYMAGIAFVMTRVNVVSSNEK